ncbi:MAG TPA: 50S ribosomal protein L23 [Candidatus Paceibacterota bacterium]|nr:50S ribosomal protein L23 [Candidatus Paceibacterota bacterium]
MTDRLLIKKPWITEKATALTASNQYVFLVKSTATKPEVKKAIHALYKVDALAVNILNRGGKTKRSGRGIRGKTEGYRKAIITIKEGQKIDLN